jgi:hypothetical protein
MVAALSTPHLLYIFPAESMASLNERWLDWVQRQATVRTRKDQSQDTPGVHYELLLSQVILRPALIGTVVIAEPRIQVPPDGGEPLILPFLPWPNPMMAGATVQDGDPDTLWVMPRTVTAADFAPRR